MRSVSSAFYGRLQETGGELAELIDLECRNVAFRWTSANNRIFSTLSGDLLEYQPFPGSTPSGIEESSDLGVAVIDFMMANTGEVFSAVMAGGDFAAAALRISRVFIDTPDLDRMVIYDGKIGDYSYNRKAVTGQARNMWKGIQTQWPYYTYQDNCAWRFGGPGCGFNTQSVTISVATSAVNVGSSTTLELQLQAGYLSNSFANGRFDFGRLTVTGGINSGQVRTIRTHVGDTLGLSYPLSVNCLTNVSFDIWPGCRKRLIEDCHSLYNNTTNFLGFPFIPIQETAF
jgi:uncharacterized phage protein (TIGR02218 family)